VRELTTRQREILELAQRYEQETLRPCPAIYLSRRLAISTLGVRHHVEALHKKGWLKSPDSPLRLGRKVVTEKR
jgi:predicted ArsR family transcriptional regulator